MKKIERAFLDTSFFIRLFKTDEQHHANAVAYFRRLREAKTTFLLSTIVVAEYGVKDDIRNLPFRECKLQPFNLNHAQLTADLARAAFEARRKGVVALENRVVIPNDTKLFAQAESEGANLFIARDDNCQKVYNFLKNEGLLSFEFLDLRTDPGVLFGELFGGM